MEQQTNHMPPQKSQESAMTRQEQVLSRTGAILLFVVAVVHLALAFRVISGNPLLGTLFLLDGVGALIAMIGVWKNARWIGWVFGILMSGGAAAVQVAVTLIPGVRARLLGVHPPIPNNNTWATISLVMEIAYLAVAVYAHFVNQKSITNKNK